MQFGVARASLCRPPVCPSWSQARPIDKLRRPSRCCVLILAPRTGWELQLVDFNLNPPSPSIQTNRIHFSSSGGTRLCNCTCTCPSHLHLLLHFHFHWHFHTLSFCQARSPIFTAVCPANDLSGTWALLASARTQSGAPTAQCKHTHKHKAQKVGNSHALNAAALLCLLCGQSGPVSVVGATPNRTDSNRLPLELQQSPTNFCPNSNRLRQTQTSS